MTVPENIRSVYFLGIGGIGMSGLARYFHGKGVNVSGYDVDPSGVSKVLESEGIAVHHTEAESILPENPDLVVYTPAIPASHPGLKHYRAAGVPVLKRSEVLGWISSRYHSIAVAGTHGKTTTSAMITMVLQKCGVDVTAFLGGLVPDLGGNFVSGTSEWLVAEADEYDRSFLTLSPDIAVVTAMDPDHLDIYGSHEAMVAAYLTFLGNVKPGGAIIIHESAARFLTQGDRHQWSVRGVGVILYGNDSGDYRVTKVQREGQGTGIEITTPQRQGLHLHLRMPGMHNALNATAALAVSARLKISVENALEALSGFSGIRRRFEVVFAGKDLVIIDDYAHHPRELAAAINAARLQYPDRKITGVFQPHLYSRTRDFCKEFAEALDSLDTCILVELYPARELPIEGVSSELILNRMTIDNKYLTQKKDLTDLLKSLHPEVLLLLGAGDLDRMEQEIITAIKTQ